MGIEQNSETRCEMNRLMGPILQIDFVLNWMSVWSMYRVVTDSPHVICMSSEQEALDQVQTVIHRRSN